jgi:cellulose synthase/poly-beta-1,6-N-acetylglucosamine synthase-like glycosyltransferase
MNHSQLEAKVTVIIPSYQRDKDLQRCLEALTRQARPADEIIIVARPTDLKTWDVIDCFNKRLPIVGAPVYESGLIQAENKGLILASGDIIAFTDDDAAPHSDWLERIIKSFQDTPSDVVGVGGRDIIYQDGHPLEKCKTIVGRISWFGRLQGNHEFGCGEARYVDALKGVNMAYRSTFIKPLGLDTRLLGRGAQMHSELMLGAQARRQRFQLIYDPAIKVDHYPGKRFGRDQRTSASPQTIFENVHNETLGILTHLTIAQRLFFILWAFFIGHRGAPGMIQVARLKFYGYPSVSMFVATQKGRILAIRRFVRGHI